MGLEEFAKSYIEGMKKDVANKYKHKVSNVATDAVKEIHSDIITDWFDDSGNPRSMIGTTVVRSHAKIDGNQIICRTHFYNDVDLYTEKPKAENWRARHSSIPSIPGKNWVFDLQMVNGIIGLPPYKKANGETHKAIIKTPLASYILCNSKWNQVFEKIVSKL